MKVRAHVYISGDVHGVFYRYNTQKEAMSLGVDGWVRNLSDGRVEGVLEGEKEAVDKLIKWCWRGPRWAHVTGVKVVWEEYRGEYSGFKVTR